MRYEVDEPDFPPPPPTSDPVIKPPEQRRVVATEEEIAALVGEAVVPETPPETVLTDDERESFRTLLTVGRRRKTISVMGHSVEIQTLNVDDELRIGLFCRQYQDSQGFSRAYQAAVCAAGIRSVSGNPLVSSLIQDPDPDSLFSDKVKEVTKFYPIVVSQIYRNIIELEAEYAELAKKLGKLQG